MTYRYCFIVIAVISVVFACKPEKPVEQKKTGQVVIVKPKQRLLTSEQRKELGFPSDLIARVELAAGAEAEPFFVTEVVHSENLKGEKGFETSRLAGFSVRAKGADEVLTSLRPSLRARGCLIFRSSKSYGMLPDIITVVKGNSSYDILKIQATEAPNYHMDTKTIIAWLKGRQKQGSFVITGAGPDWIEARFIRPPNNLSDFAKQVILFAPDVLERGTKTVDKLTERMEKMNGFYLMWD